MFPTQQSYQAVASIQPPRGPEERAISALAEEIQMISMFTLVASNLREPARSKLLNSLYQEAENVKVNVNNLITRCIRNHALQMDLQEITNQARFYQNKLRRLEAETFVQGTFSSSSSSSSQAAAMASPDEVEPTPAKRARHSYEQGSRFSHSESSPLPYNEAAAVPYGEAADLLVESQLGEGPSLSGNFEADAQDNI